MSAQATLRLVELDTPDTLAPERRVATRYVIKGSVTAVRKPPDDEDDSNRICSVELINISDTGLGVMCREAIELESRITICFTPHGPERSIDLHGRVVRCDTYTHGRSNGHEIGIRLDKRQAA